MKLKKLIREMRRARVALLEAEMRLTKEPKGPRPHTAGLYGQALLGAFCKGNSIPTNAGKTIRWSRPGVVAAQKRPR